MMIPRLTLLAAFALGACAAVPPVSDLNVDLAEVTRVGKVMPVGGVTTAGQPDEEQFRIFADSGYVAVVDLRTWGEDRGLDEPVFVADLGMEYVFFPIGRGDVTIENAKGLFEVIDRYDGPVLVHCGSGNRVGALFALKAFDDTGDVEKAIEAGKAAGLTRLEETVRNTIADR